MARTGTRFAVRKRSLLLHTCVVAFAIGSAWPAAAQPKATSTEATPPAPETTGGLGEIVVTAQRRAENLQDVPISVTALTNDEIRSAGTVSTDQLQQAVPGLVSFQRSNAFVPYIRGVGSNQTGSGIESSIAVYLDGIYQGAKAGNIFDLTNIERIEVLKGPQGTLFGRNATGGAINIITKAPGKRTEVDLSASYGRFAEKILRAYAAAPITDTISGSVSFSGRWDHGWITNPLTGDKQNPVESLLGMVRLRWQPSSDLDVNLSGSYSFVDDPSWVAPHLAPGSLSVGQTRGGLATYNDDETLISTNEPFNQAKAWRATLTALYDLGPVELYNISGYVKTESPLFVDLDGTTANVAHLGIDQLSKQFSQELQLRSSQPGPLTWIAGVYYLWLKDGHGEGRQNQTVELGLPRPFRAADLLLPGRTLIGTTTFSTTNAASAFGQATYELAPRLKITAGLRYSWERKLLEGRNYRYSAVAGTTGVEPPRNSVPAGDGLVFATTPIGSVDTHKSWKNWSWRLALDYHFTDDVMGYVSYSRGFKSGAYSITVISPTNRPVDPETLDAYEVGFRSDLLDRHLRLNASAFYYDYKDIQLSLVTGTGVATFQNAASGELYGIDAEAVASITRNLQLRGSLNWLHSRYKNFPNANVALPNVVGIACSVPPRRITIDEKRQIASLPPTGGNCTYSLDATGLRMIFAPKFTANVGVNYELPMRGGSKVIFDTTLYYNSGFDVEAGGVNAEIPSFETLAASIFWHSADDRWRVGLWGRNLTNDRHAVGVSTFPQATQEFSARPRTIGATVGVQFGS